MKSFSPNTIHNLQFSQSNNIVFVSCTLPSETETLKPESNVDVRIQIYGIFETFF